MWSTIIFPLIVLTFDGTWGSTFVLHYSLDTATYFIFNFSFKCWYQTSSLFQESDLWNMIGVPNNEMQWLITPTVDIACKMITLIYISRCQKDSEPLEYMHYTGTIFSYKPFIGEFDFVPDTEIFSWLVNLQSYGNKISRSLLFARNHPNSQTYSIPILELETALQQEYREKRWVNLFINYFGNCW